MKKEKKHEKAILVSLAYLIGFITAFIAFAINDADQATPAASGKPVADKMEYQAMENRSGIEAVIKDDGLFMKNGDKERILSAHMKLDKSEDGYHDSIASTSVSPDGNFIFYCAVLLAGDDDCMSYVYSVAEDTVYKVSDGEKKILVPIEKATDISWSGDDRLQMEGMASVSAATPWHLR